ncbi:MAG: YihA family ribosome biogenesis GTP-binding protein [Lachnospiraceae bacterium]|nr:YihA family ribosome biogenesis GTP-binding protein [Lachnospiraceae bacterium]MBQ8329100.1 YihA family ribosome biogenesis GTP-binding protein [Lachnospiraceae bacterium]
MANNRISLLQDLRKRYLYTNKTQKGICMVIKTVNLETVCGITSKLPENTKPEFAFAGKSNVGKSTLINALMNRKSYARTSSTPGKTQTINYYNVNDEFYLVDLPGYGYATAGVKVKQQWGKMIENYLHTSKKLDAVFLLVDIRHEPSENDVMMFDWILAAGFTPYIVATKSDKIKRSQLAKQTAMIRRTIMEKSKVSHDVSFEVIPFSGLNKAGREDLYNIIEGFFTKENDMV